MAGLGIGGGWGRGVDIATGCIGGAGVADGVGAGEDGLWGDTKYGVPNFKNAMTAATITTTINKLR